VQRDMLKCSRKDSIERIEGSNRFLRENGFIKTVDIRPEADHQIDQAALQPWMIPTR